MRLLLLTVTALSIGVAASPASACQWEYAPEPIGGPSASFIAPKMAAEATFIDIALAEGAGEIVLPPGTHRGMSQMLSFRVIKRLKGQSADRFILFGGLGDAKPGGEWGMTHWVDRQGRIYPHRGVLEGQPALPQGMTSCDPPVLTVALGRLYLVMREADGRLLGSVPYHPGLAAAGTSITLASEYEPDDFTRQVMIAVDPSAQERLSQPVTAAESGRATVFFRRSLGLAAAQAVLRSSGGTPWGALVSRGGTITDYRLGSEYAFPRLLDDALVFTAQAVTRVEALKAIAGRIVDQTPAASFDDYDPSNGQVAALLAASEEKEQAAPVFVAVDVVADAASQARLARDPAVLRVEGGKRVRRAVAAGTIAPRDLVAADRASLFPRLVKLAGKGLPGNAVDGRWSVTGSFERFKKVPVTLTLRGGVAEATSDCFGPLRGSYSLDGLILKLRLPVPDPTQCAKTQEYWSLEYLLGPKDFTVRLDGDRLRLQGAAGSDFQLERLGH